MRFERAFPSQKFSTNSFCSLLVHFTQFCQIFFYFFYEFCWWYAHKKNIWVKESWQRNLSGLHSGLMSLGSHQNIRFVYLTPPYIGRTDTFRFFWILYLLALKVYIWLVLHQQSRFGLPFSRMFSFGPFRLNGSFLRISHKFCKWSHSFKLWSFEHILPIFCNFCLIIIGLQFRSFLLHFRRGFSRFNSCRIRSKLRLLITCLLLS